MASQIPSSQLDIVNKALPKIGEPILANLSGTDEVTALINSVWGCVVTGELQAYAWKFSVKRARIAAEVLYGTSGSAVVSGTWNFIPITTNTYVAGESVTITNSVYYNGTFPIKSGAASGVWISGTYNAETFSGVEKMYGAPAWGWEYRFAVPADSLKFLQIGEQTAGLSMADYRTTDSTDYRIEGSYIHRHTSDDVEVRYVRPPDYEDLTDTTGYDPLFTDVLACALAVELCERVTRKTDLKRVLEVEYEHTLARALRAGAIEAAPEPPMDNEWILARR